MSIKTIITDIEGTTTDINFVHNVLFPYARAKLPAYIQAHYTEDAVKSQLLATGREMGLAESDLTTELPAHLNQLIEQLIAWIDADQKITPLKALQGQIWAVGFQAGDFQGHVYPDAAQYLKAWHEAGITLGIFSSGSIKSQKLLFSHTSTGDLTGLFQYYFDTTTGPKKAPQSYVAIAKAVNTLPSDILFLSDVVAELDAAAQAGLKTCLLVRSPTSQTEELSTPKHKHLSVENFRDIALTDFDTLGA